MRTLVLASMFGAALSACTPYSPDLGESPFKCGPEEQSPRCPDGYSCRPAVGSAEEHCVRDGDDGVLPDSGTNACANDSAVEPNDTTGTAWITPVDNTKTFELASLAICPAGDKDNYSVMMTTANQNLEMIIRYPGGGADLQGSILNSGGIAIANATVTTAGTKRAYTPNLPTGIYYIQVSGPSSGTLTTNNYELDINVTGP